jgi:UDP-N-acetylmuramate: L-alanyl-gamma-D-glutamyl-meso-diaminopimelate ligase
MKTIRHIHLVGICGVGMGSLAGILNASGYHVTGSDENFYPPMAKMLKSLKIEILTPYRPENLEPVPDLVIIGNTARRDNPEAAAVIARGIPYMSFPVALREFFLKEKFPVIVAGTHGKTTSSSMVGWILDQAGRAPGILVGGIMKNYDAGFIKGRNGLFVLEGDEYSTSFFDSSAKFLHYMPASAVVTSIEFDHADVYRDLDHVKEEFTRFIRLLPPDGFLVACADYPAVLDILPQSPCRVVTYGLSKGAEYRAGYLRFSEEGSRFSVHRGEEKIGCFSMASVGRHNVQNALGAIVTCLNLGIDVETVKRGLATFLGIKKRQEVKAVIDDIIILDDYAHHPTKVRESVAATRARYPGRRLWAVFEPRTNSSRRAFFQNDYPGSFEGADSILVADVYNPEQIDPGERFSSSLLVEDLRRAGRDAHFLPTADEIVDFLSRKASQGDVILIMSNGSFDSLDEKLVNFLVTRTADLLAA